MASCKESLQEAKNQRAFSHDLDRNLQDVCIPFRILEGETLITDQSFTFTEVDCPLMKQLGSSMIYGQVVLGNLITVSLSQPSRGSLYVCFLRRLWNKPNR